VPQTGLWLRVFVALLLTVLPPILLLVGVLLLTESVLEDADPNLVAVLVAVGVVAWSAILAMLFTRALAEEQRSLLDLAQRGGASGTTEGDGASRQLAAALDERNRQVAALARHAAAVPIDDDPARVATALVTALRLVMGDPTWRLAVLASDDPALLPSVVYGAAGEEAHSESIGDLERWASVTGTEETARRIEGPWGAFAVVDVSSTDLLRAVLLAPWEGRLDPTPAELDLMRLVGQQTGIALEHALLYARVRTQADELTRLAGVQADFLRGVTHDLQTPLTSIAALATELRANEHVPDGARADLDSISHQADRLRRMVSQLLVASRLEAGVVTPRQEVFAVRPLVERTWEALRADRPFELLVEGTPHLAVADPDRLEQVLWAVLDNAMKYSPPASPIEVRVSPVEGRLAISVRDHGTGMDDETQRRAFEQFYRSDQARRLAPDGSGVGLYAAQGLMEAMGGALEISSRLGDGTTMSLFVPAEVSDSGE
jgi:signal transduction histidine kinase